MELQKIREKINQMKGKYLLRQPAQQVDNVIYLDEKKARAIKRKLVHLESIRCQKICAGQNLTEIEAKINQLKTDFKALEIDKRR